jgi:hypothetical protein
MPTIERDILDGLNELAVRVGGLSASHIVKARELLESANRTSRFDEQAEFIRLAGESLKAITDLSADDTARVAKLAAGLEEYAEALADLAARLRRLAR